MTPLLSFISCSNIPTTSCCSLQERRRESSRNQLFCSSLQKSTRDRRCPPWEAVGCGESSNLTGLPGRISQTPLQQQWKWLWDRGKIRKDAGWVTANRSVSSRGTQVRLETTGSRTQFPSGTLGNSINLFLPHSCHVRIEASSLPGGDCTGICS